MAKFYLMSMVVGGPSGYLKDYDVDAWDGRGRVDLTEKTEEAMEFPDFMAAMQAWRTQSTVVPLRPDGKPNRPLTAFHAEVKS